MQADAARPFLEIAMVSYRMTTRARWLPWLAAWLAFGVLALALTPITAWTPMLGWAPGLSLVAAPLLLLVVAAPRLPLALLAAALRQLERRPHYH
jgi:hypothetical protein